MERELLRIHRELETTFVYVTHDQTQAMRLADQIIVMNDGKLEQSGSVDAVYNSPATAFVATFVGDSNTFRGTVTEVNSEGSVATVKTDFGTFQATTANLHSEPDEVVEEDIALSIRPHFIRLDESADNTLTCAVEDVIYQPGSGTQLVLEASGSSNRTREIQMKSFEQLHVDGDTVVVGWDAERTTMLERTSVVAGVDLEKDILGE
jgi:ABC-type Fe3+/spermidine/putrescine transport system ATPase subunit